VCRGPEPRARGHWLEAGRGAADAAVEPRTVGRAEIPGLIAATVACVSSASGAREREIEDEDTAGAFIIGNDKQYFLCKRGSKQSDSLERDCLYYFL
jgi:hypothetical protein